MDVSKLLKGVKNLDNYMAVTQDLAYKYKNAKLQFNMSTVLSLKNIRSLEIEYFNKCDDSGAAFLIFERMLLLPPSKTWSLLGKELVSLIQYWLDAVRKHLISHHPHWWSFLKQLLKFVMDLLQKDHALNNILIEQTTDGFLDLATRGRLNVSQRHEILHTLNMYCAESSKDIRYALRTEFEHYFIRLATIMASCGHLPTQYSIMETLLRWLLPRHDQAVRKEAALKWFPEHLYNRQAVQLFLERPWHNFFQDARDFLNAHNVTSDLVTSVVCRKLSVGDHMLVSGAERRPTWLDINTADSGVSVQLDPRALEPLGAASHNSCETLTVTSDITLAAKLYRESSEVTVQLSTSEPPQLYPSSGSVFGCGVQRVRAVISSRGDLLRVDNALRAVFHDKYEVLLDFENMTSLSPPLPEHPRKSKDEDTRFSHPAKDVKRRKQSGYIVRPAKPVSIQSPSTASTSSLAQLHEKLAALPRYKYDKEVISVCAQPELSGVTELSEISENIRHGYDTDSTLKLRPCGVVIKSLRNCTNNTKKSLSDSDVAKEKPKKPTADSSDTDGNHSSDITNFQIFNKSARDNAENKSHDGSVKEKARNTVSQEKINENSTSCLLIATIGTADQSVINDTLERLSKNKDYSADNIVDLLVQEALQAQSDDDRLQDSGINTEDGKKSQGVLDAIEDTPNVEPYKPISIVRSKRLPKDKCTVISKSTSDESNTEAINEPPISYVSVRKRNQRKKSLRRSCEQSTEDAKIIDVPNNNNVVIFGAKTVEDFFSQHFTENKAGDLALSPTLAKKINATSSESSEDFDHCLISNQNDNLQLNIEQYEISDIQIIECLNDMVDKICSNFEKCTEYLDKEDEQLDTMDIAGNKNVVDDITNKIPRQDNGNTKKTKNTKTISKGKSGNTKVKPKQIVKLTFTETKTQKATTRNKIVKKKAQLQPLIMTPIIEANNEVSDVSVKITSPKPGKVNEGKNKLNFDSPLQRRKRKLYSPKDDYVMPDVVNKNKIVIDNASNMCNDNEDDTALSEFKKSTVTPNPTTACHKELETERLKYKRVRKRSRGKTESPSLSPKTKKNNVVFDALKDSIETNVKITLADKKVFDEDIAIFNFTSDSEDEDFKKKKIDLQKRISTTTVDSGNSMISTRRVRSKKVDYTEKECADSTDEGEKKKLTVKRIRATKRGNSKSSTRSKSSVRKINVNAIIELEDERMRGTIPDELNTSLLIKNPKENIENKEIAPAITAPQLDLIVVDDDGNKNTVESIIEKKKATRKTERQAKKEKAVKRVALLAAEDKDDDRTISPLPGLVVETVPAVQNEADDSLTSNMVQKIKRLCQEGPDAINDTNTTHNLLSDIERTNVSMQINVTEELNGIIEEDNPKYDIFDKEKKASVVPKASLEKKLSVISNIEKLNVCDNNELSNNTLRDDKSVTTTKHSRNNPAFAVAPSGKKRTLTLKSKREIYKSTESSFEKEVMRSEKSKSCLVEPKNNEERTKKFDSQSRYAKNKSPDRGDKTEVCRKVICNNDSTSFIKPKFVTNPIETVDISDITEMKSEKSIASAGITGHGDLSEDPPSPKTLKEKLFPRELEDMDEAVKEYYVALQKQMIVSTNNSDEESNKRVETGNCKNVVLVKRLSIDDISKRLHQNVASKRPMKDQENKYRYDYSKWFTQNSDSEGSNSTKVSKNKDKSPIVSITRLPNDMSKWFECSKNDESSNSSEKYTTDTANCNKDPKATKQKLKNNSSPNDSKRLSIISPIKLFGDGIRNKRKPQDDSSEDETEKQDRNATSKDSTTSQSLKPYLLRNISHRSNGANDKVSSKDSKKPYFLRNISHRSNESSPGSNMSTSTRVEDSRISAKPLPSKGVKIRKLNDDYTRSDVVHCEKGPSISSVDDWLRTQPESTRDQNVSVRDTVQNLMEKLDTTLAELHQSTTKNFIDLFVSAQKQLSEMKEEREELNRRFEEKEREFMEWLQERAVVFIREDCAKKRVMVSLLREDVQAVLDHLDGRRET